MKYYKLTPKEEIDMERTARKLRHSLLAAGDFYVAFYKSEAPQWLVLQSYDRPSTEQFERDFEVKQIDLEYIIDVV